MADELKEITLEYTKDIDLPASPEGGSLTQGFYKLDNVKTITIGAGDNSFRSSTQGIGLGSEQWTFAPFRVSMSGALTATSATITGTINANAGSIGGWTINSDYLAKDTGIDNTSAGLSPANYPFYAGATYAHMATAPFRVTSDGLLYASNATISGSITATTGQIGGFDIGADYIRDTADTFGLASTVTVGDDIRIWGGASFANRASANFYITESGQALFKYVTISGGSNVKFISDTIDTENKNILKDFTFSPSDYSGAFKSGNITWNSSTGAITGGSGIVMHKGGIVGAKNGNATFSINASTGDATFAGTLSAASGTLGVITTGQITLDTTGYVRGGMTDYMTGIGVFLGYTGGAYKFSVGDPSGEYMSWNGTNLVINDTTLDFQSIFGGGSDGNVTISSNTSLSSDMYYNNLTVNSGKVLTCNGYRIFVKGTLTNNGTICANGGNGGNGGNATGTYNPGTGGTAGVISGVGSILSGIAGVAGTAGHYGYSANPGTGVSKGIGVNGTAGGYGKGIGTGNPPGGTAGTITGTIYNKIKNFTSAYNLFDIFPGSVILPFYTSAGSGGGAGGYSTSYNNEGGGGGSGASGGFCWISAKKINNTATGIIQANGGNGGNGGNGYVTEGVTFAPGGGGGAGGSGGVIILIYSSLTNSGTIEAKGGTGGTGGLGYFSGVLNPTYDGGAGSNGNDGKIIYLKQ